MAEIPKTPPPLYEGEMTPRHPDAVRLDAALAEAKTRMPPYYRLPGLFLADGTPADAMHLVENAWPDVDNFCEKDVLKYLLRAGRKPGVPEARDWLKIVRVAARKYRRLSGEELPDDV